MSEEASTPAKKAAKKVTAKKAATQKTAAKKAAKKTSAKKTATKKATTKKVAKKTSTKKAASPAEAAPSSAAQVTTESAAPSPAPKPVKTPAPEQAKESAPPQEGKQAKAPAKKNGRVRGGGPVQKHENSQDGENKNRNHGNRNGRNNNNRNRRNNNRNRRNGNRERRETKPVELTGPPVAVSGILELSPKGFGFLRELSSNLEQSNNDVFISPDIVRVNGLREGLWIKAIAKEGPRGLQIVEINSVNDKPVDEARKLPHFEELKAVNPSKRIPFETESDRFSTRVLDIIAPIGRGQRGLIVSPPRSGKTTMMQHMAEAVRDKYSEEMHLMILLVDERPEEVTEFKMNLPEAEIYASSNDSGAKNHCRVAELCIERAKRLVEAGEHVFLLMDSITRLARAYNTNMGGNKKGKGRGIQSGGIISGALEVPRQLFAAARNTREAGSLTIVATALVHTNSRADEAIFQEFKGTGNMELCLDRRIAEQYIFPAVDIFKSGTRREELLLPEHMLHKIHLIRRGLSGARPHEAMERLIFFLKRFHNNAQMLLEIKG
ncbi:transcription termination factor Rho [Rubritalea marina]|uniref:transcription termination factor Rho n=1 Tax=Rubritalea marina TaxID=361055 RepID=UPI00037C76A8|nr:transcription termination factor Rho [Rubritalea marina]